MTESGFGFAQIKREGGLVEFDRAQEDGASERSCWMEIRLGEISRAEVHALVEAWMDREASGPVELRLAIEVQVPQSWSKRKQAQALNAEILPTTKPDVDNVEKAICDGLNGVAWRDDVQVTDVIKRKRYSATPCVRVEIRPAVTAASAQLAAFNVPAQPAALREAA